MKISKSVSNRELKSPVSFLSLSSFDLTKLRPNRPLFGLPKLLKPDFKKKNSQNTINTSWKPIETSLFLLYLLCILVTSWKPTELRISWLGAVLFPVPLLVDTLQPSTPVVDTGRLDLWILGSFAYENNGWLTGNLSLGTLGGTPIYSTSATSVIRIYPHLAWLSLNMGYPEITWFVRWTILGCTLVSNIPKYRSMSYCWLSMVISYEISPSSAWYIIDISPFADISS